MEQKEDKSEKIENKTLEMPKVLIKTGNKKERRYKK